MRNWSTDAAQFDKHSSEFVIWRLEQLINFGLQGEKLKTNVLRMYLPSLTIDSSKKKFLEFLLKNVKTD